MLKVEVSTLIFHHFVLLFFSSWFLSHFIAQQKYYCSFDFLTRHIVLCCIVLPFMHACIQNISDKFWGSIESNHSCFLYGLWVYWLFVVVGFFFIHFVSVWKQCNDLFTLDHGYVCVLYTNKHEMKNRQLKRGERNKIKSDRYVVILNHPKHRAHLLYCCCYVMVDFILFCSCHLSFRPSVCTQIYWTFLIRSIAFGRILN